MNLQTNSRLVKSGDYFFAIKGINFDGNMFIKEALDNGAALIVTDDKNFITKENIQEKVLVVKDVKDSLAEFSKNLYPHEPQFLAGVTGTNGKTSTVEYFRQICKLLGKSSASIGTLGVISNAGLKFDTTLTTNDIVTNRMILSSLAQNNVNYVAFEASSHGLLQKRFGGIKFNASAFTNFSLDHLDYHLDLQNYKKTKLKLLSQHTKNIFVMSEEVMQTAKEFLNTDSNIEIKTIGKNQHNNLYIKNITQNSNKQYIKFIYESKKYEFSTEIVGSFQIYNILFAGILAQSCDLDFDKIVSILNQLKAPSGRLEKVFNNLNIFIDYAHNPDALKLILKELTKLKQSIKHYTKQESRLFLIFGCGGNRDASKRPLMGNIASQYADYLIITDDNPRHEEAKKIRSDIISGINKKQFIEIGDRKQAIYHALNLVTQNDVLLVAGKGHEQYQEIKSNKVKFSDKQIIIDYFGIA